MTLVTVQLINGHFGDGYSDIGWYPQNSWVSIYASHLPGWTFQRWTGTYASIVNALSEHTSLKTGLVDCQARANYNINYYTFNYYAGPGGYISGDPHQIVAYMEDGTTVWAVPNDGYHFVKWSDDDTNEAKQPVNVTGNYSATAEFAQDEPDNPYYTLTVNSGTGDGSYHAGINVNIVADTPAEGYHFTFWSGDTTGITDIYSASTVIHMQDANTEITANYASDEVGPWDLLYTAGTGGSISGDADQVVINHGNGTEVIAVPNEGYTFEKWSDDVLTAARTDLDIEDDLSVSASFTLIPVVYQKFPQVIIY